MTTRERILAALPTTASDAVTTAAVCERTGLTSACVTQQISRLVRAGLVVRVERGSYRRAAEGAQ